MAYMVRNLEWHAANGDIIRFSQAPPFMLKVFYPGVSSGAAETVRGVRTDGQTTYHVSAEPLTPSAVGTVIATGGTHDEAQRNLDNLRRRLQAALNPKHFGTLIYNNFAGSFRLPCRPITGTDFGDRFANACPFDIEWISDTPYWTEAAPRALNVGVIKKMWVFLWVIKPTVFGSILSKGLINNPTNIDIYPKIIISATESEKITVGNRTTGDYVTITHSISQTQKLELDMSVPSAELVDENGTRTPVDHWTTDDSVFPWSAVPGINEIYSAVDNPELSPVITLIWYQPEGGI